jgi:hypothetical protein
MNDRERLYEFNEERTDSFHPDYYDDVDAGWYEWHGMSPAECEEDCMSTMTMFVRATVLAVVIAVILFGLCLAGC